MLYLRCIYVVCGLFLVWSICVSVLYVVYMLYPYDIMFVMFFYCSVVVCVVFSLISTGLVKAFLFVSILLVPTSIVETDVLGESIADTFVLLITSRLPPILTLTCIVVACAVAALIDGFRSLSPFISLSVRPAIV